MPGSATAAILSSEAIEAYRAIDPADSERAALALELTAEAEARRREAEAERLTAAAAQAERSREWHSIDNEFWWNAG
jgi:hypothetical protein